MADLEQSVAHYDQHASAMRNQDYFYNWLVKAVRQHVPNQKASICDIGCGPGALLARLWCAGYTQLTGVDFSSKCLALADHAVPCITLARHDIARAPLPASYDALLMTSVLDFLPEPVCALANARQSLRPGGVLLVTVRNRSAYWPLYHLRGLAGRLGRAPRLRHWFLWFTTPLGMRREDQPFERVYTLAEARNLIRAAGLTPVAAGGMMRLPMLWIPGLPRLIGVMIWADRVTAPLLGSAGCYYIAFACKAARAVEHGPSLQPPAAPNLSTVEG
jgi:SAM-dependent methyltransferase